MKKKDNIKFEAALKRLEEIVVSLEDGVDELDRVLELFREGSELLALCRNKLKNIENKIEIVSDDGMETKGSEV